MQNTQIALYVKMLLSTTFGEALFRPGHDATLTMAFSRWTQPQGNGYILIRTRDELDAHRKPYVRSQDISPEVFHQMNRPVRQPHCPSAANAVKKAKAAARGLNNE